MRQHVLTESYESTQNPCNYFLLLNGEAPRPPVWQIKLPETQPITEILISYLSVSNVVDSTVRPAPQLNETLPWQLVLHSAGWGKTLCKSTPKNVRENLSNKEFILVASSRADTTPLRQEGILPSRSQYACLFPVYTIICTFRVKSRFWEYTGNTGTYNTSLGQSAAISTFKLTGLGRYTIDLQRHNAPGWYFSNYYHVTAWFCILVQIERFNSITEFSEQHLCGYQSSQNTSVAFLIEYQLFP